MKSHSSSDHELNIQIQYRLIEQISESERRYRELVENLQEIVFKCDHAGNLTFINKAWTLDFRIQCIRILKSPNRSLSSYRRSPDLAKFPHSNAC